MVCCLSKGLAPSHVGRTACLGPSPGRLRVRFRSSLTLQIARREGRACDGGGHITASCCTPSPVGCGGAAQGSISGAAGASQWSAPFAPFVSLLPDVMGLLLEAPLSLLSHWGPERHQDCCSSLPLRCRGGHGPLLEAFVSPKEENGQLVAT